MVTTRTTYWPDKTQLVFSSLLVLLILTAPTLAHAAGTGGNFPWNQSVNTFTQAIVSLGFALIMLGLFCLGAMFIQSREWGHFANGFVAIIVAGALMVGGPTVATALGITGAVV